MRSLADDGAVAELVAPRARVQRAAVRDADAEDDLVAGLERRSLALVEVDRADARAVEAKVLDHRQLARRQVEPRVHAREEAVEVLRVEEDAGVVAADGASRGILVTSGRFTNDARSFAAGKPLDLVDGPTLAQLVRNVQVSESPGMAAPPVPSDTEPVCPKCGSPMVLRTARRGANIGSQFYGCSRYPQCRGTRPLA